MNAGHAGRKIHWLGGGRVIRVDSLQETIFGANGFEDAALPEYPFCLLRADESMGIAISFRGRQRLTSKSLPQVS